MNEQLGPERAFVFRITHISNVAWILMNGLHCRNSNVTDPNFVDIGNPDLISKRSSRAVPICPYGTLSDYVPFYFTPYSPMLYNIKTGYNGITQRPMSEIAILVSSLHRLRELDIPFVFTDRHAYLKMADQSFSSDLEDLDRIDWRILKRRDFKRDPEDPGKFERYQAEALIHQHLPVSALLHIGCYSAAAQTDIRDAARVANATVETVVEPGWYF